MSQEGNSTRTILDYQLISEQGVVGFEREVKKAIKDGWQPLGPAFPDGVYAHNNYVMIYNQTMVKYAPDRVTVKR